MVSLSPQSVANDWEARAREFQHDLMNYRLFIRDLLKGREKEVEEMGGWAVLWLNVEEGSWERGQG